MSVEIDSSMRNLRSKLENQFNDHQKHGYRLAAVFIHRGEFYVSTYSIPIILTDISSNLKERQRSVTTGFTFTISVERSGASTTIATSPKLRTKRRSLVIMTTNNNKPAVGIVQQRPIFSSTLKKAGKRRFSSLFVVI